MLSLPMPILLAARPVEGQGWIGHWSPGIGDPSVAGWITVVLYLAAAWLCLQCARWSRSAGPRPSRGRSESRLWAAFALVLLALGINKQLDLQTAFTEVMRVLSREEGWYESRRRYQFAFIGAVAVLSASAGVALMAVTRRLDRAVRLGALGMVLVLAFVAARATSFHHVDELLGTRVLYLRVNWILEIGGIAVVIASGAARRRRLMDTGKPRRRLGHGREQPGQRKETPSGARYD